jgi:hypothetical protein
MYKYSILLLIFFQTAYADSEAPPYPRITSANNSSAYFIMLPDPNDYNGGKGAAYRLGRDGESTKLWGISGWYAHTVHISKDGRYLVREGNWARGSEPKPEDVAVVFYDKGVELRSFATTDLVKNASKVRGSIGHYLWRGSGCKTPQLNYKNEFCLRTIDKIEYIFDATTGNVISEKNVSK